MNNGIPSAFDNLRLPYKGTRDTIKCIEVDLKANRLYAACCSGGVFVWDLATHKPLAVLRHPQWVNVMRCFPPVDNSGTQEDTSALARLRRRDERMRGDKDKAGSSGEPAAAMAPSTTELLLSGCEDGVLSAWSPVTFRIREQYKPGHGPITTMQLGLGPRDAMLTSDSGTVPPLCYVASLESVYVMRVQPTFQLLHQFRHKTFVTAIECVHSARLPAVVVGQETGQIITWSLDTWSHTGNLAYPAGEEDIDEDAKKQGITVPRQDFVTSKVVGTFAYNLRRCENVRHSGLREDGPSSAELAAEYKVIIPSTIAPYQTELPRGRGGSVEPANDKRPLGFLKNPVAMPELEYDRRRVTCLSSGHQTAFVTDRFYSGHATGEVLIWEAPFTGYPYLLMKKVRVFRGPRTWVWGLCSMEVHMSAAMEVFADSKSAAAAQPGTMNGRKLMLGGTSSQGAVSAALKKKKAGTDGAPLPPVRTASSVEKRPYFHLLMVAGDNGEVMYMNTRRTVRIKQGPGVLPTAVFYWHGPAIVPPRPKSAKEEKEQQRASSRQSTASAASRSEPRENKEVLTPASSKAPSTMGLGISPTKAKEPPAAGTGKRHHIVMGTFEGRIERFDVSAVVKSLLSSGD